MNVISIANAGAALALAAALGLASTAPSFAQSQRHHSVSRQHAPHAVAPRAAYDSHRADGWSRYAPVYGYMPSFGGADYPGSALEQMRRAGAENPGD